MAIRLEAHFPVVQISDITVADSPSASKVRLEVSAPTVQFTDVTLIEHASIPLMTAPVIGVGIQYQYMKMAKAVFKKMVAAGIWVDADTDNRILTDISTIIESISTEMDKPLTDTALVSEIAAIAVSRPATDSTGVSDSSTLWAELGPSDQVTFAEALNFVMQAVFSDVAVIAEQHAIYMVRDPFTDSTGVQDLPRIHTTRPASSGDGYILSDSSNWSVNKNTPELVTLVETRAFVTTKPLADTSDVQELHQLALTRPVEDGANVADGSSWSIDKGQTETVTFTEQQAFTSTKPISEPVLVNELITGSMVKPVFETVAAADTIGLAAQFQRIFLDTIALDDDVLVINGLAVQPFDAPITSDTAQWALGRLVADTAVVLEVTQFGFSKSAGDSAQTSDTFHRSAQFQRSFSDTIALDDISNVDKNWDATKQNIATINDASQFNLTAAYSDSTLVQDAYQYAANKLLTESIGVSDVLTIQISSGSIPVFNGVTFNSSTFG